MHTYNCRTIRPVPLVLSSETVPHHFPSCDSEICFCSEVWVLIRLRSWSKTKPPAEPVRNLNPTRAYRQSANPAPPVRDHAICPALRVRYKVIKLYTVPSGRDKILSISPGSYTRRTP